MYCIYIHKNKINGKVYVGKTNNVKRRWKGDGYYYQSCSKFYAAIQKYGWENFEHIILEDDLTLEQANNREQYYINFYNSQQNGYNILNGGDGLGDYWLNPQHQKEQSFRRKEYFRNHPETIETFLKNVKSKNAIQKQSLTQKEKYTQGKSHLNKINEERKKSIKCIETGEIFHSITDAANAYNINIYNLSTHLNHPDKRKSCGKIKEKKMHWCFI